jgi:predicted nuclease of predicted toxin-antitoxin system
MKFKIDENLPVDAAILLSEAGHDAHTVLQEGLGGVGDQELAALCKREGRTLVTLDQGFADIRLYPPNQFPGLIVFKLHSQNKFSVVSQLQRLAGLLEKESPNGQLWIVELSRVRVRE